MAGKWRNLAGFASKPVVFRAPLLAKPVTPGNENICRMGIVRRDRAFAPATMAAPGFNSDQQYEGDAVNTA